MNYRETMRDITARARRAAPVLADMTEKEKNFVLLSMGSALAEASNEIKKANKADVAVAEKRGLGEAFIDRLTLTDKRLEAMRGMFNDVAALKDPVGSIIDTRERPNGLVIKKVRVPIGVIGIIYESRPNVTADCVSLCFKSGNVAILRGGSDSIGSNLAIYRALKAGALKAGANGDFFILIEDTSRELVDEMLIASDGIDLIMPRGGEALIKQVTEKSRIPVIKHYKGICHVYVDKNADLAMAESVCINAKVQRPGVCNAMETMLVHKDIAEKFLKSLVPRLFGLGVKIKGCDTTRKIAGSGVEKASDSDFSTEWLDLVLNVKVVDSIGEAVSHIEKFGSRHSDAIITSDKRAADEFTRKVDSAAVYVNASTRFTDGGEFGMGAEIGISTDKIHARGPMGLEELTIYKYIVEGNGQVRG